MSKQFPGHGFEIIAADNGDPYLRVGESLYSYESVLGALEAQFTVDVDEETPELPPALDDDELRERIEADLKLVRKSEQLEADPRDGLTFTTELIQVNPPPLVPQEPVTINRGVHYVAAGSKDGTYPSVCRGADVTEVHPDPDGAEPLERVGLMVKNPQGIHFPNYVCHDPAGAPMTWHWYWECPHH